MNKLQNKDQKFFLIFISIAISLITINLPLFIKNLANQKFANPYLKTVASQLKLSPWRQAEQQLWNRIKTTDLETKAMAANSSTMAPIPTEPAQNVAVKSPLTNPNYQKFLLVGDSSMYELGLGLNYNLRIFHNIKNVRLEYRAATGLHKTDYYNWYLKTPEFIESYQADVLIILFGADDLKYFMQAGDNWQETYRQQVDKYAKSITNSSIKKVYWVAQPISNIDGYNATYQTVNKIYRDVSLKYDKIQFVDTWDSFAIKNKFAHRVADQSGKQDYVRVSDGLHFTNHGATILSETIIDQMIKERVLPSQNPKLDLAKNFNQGQLLTINNLVEDTANYERFLLVGDSTMYDLSIVLNYDLRKLYNIQNIRLDYRVSSGLNRIDYYDWFKNTPEFIENYQADVLVVIFGGNDNQDIVDSNGKYHSQLSEGWQQTYRERVEKYAELLDNSSIKKVYWVGQPISNVGNFNKFFPVVNGIYRDVSSKYNKIEFVDTWNAFAIDGKFAPIVASQSGKKAYVRVNDGVHFTAHGAKILGERVIEQMLQDQVIAKP